MPEGARHIQARHRMGAYCHLQENCAMHFKCTVYTEYTPKSRACHGSTLVYLCSTPAQGQPCEVVYARVSHINLGACLHGSTLSACVTAKTKALPVKCIPMQLAWHSVQH